MKSSRRLKRRKHASNRPTNSWPHFNSRRKRTVSLILSGGGGGREGPAGRVGGGGGECACFQQLASFHLEDEDVEEGLLYLRGVQAGNTNVLKHTDSPRETRGWRETQVRNQSRLYGYWIGVKQLEQIENGHFFVGESVYPSVNEDSGESVITILLY